MAKVSDKQALQSKMNSIRGQQAEVQSQIIDIKGQRDRLTKVKDGLGPSQKQDIDAQEASLRFIKSGLESEMQATRFAVEDIKDDGEVKRKSQYQENFYHHSVRQGMQQSGDMEEIHSSHQEVFTKIANETESQKSKIFSKILTKAKEFWQKENDYWQDLNAAGVSEENRGEINQLLIELSTKELQLASHFDISELSDVKSFTGSKSERDSLQAEIDDMKLEIGNLHTNL